MITSISNNFGASPITLKCHDSAKIVVLQGSLFIAPDTPPEVVAISIKPPAKPD